jgi:hypothetical protein
MTLRRLTSLVAVFGSFTLLGMGCTAQTADESDPGDESTGGDAYEAEAIAAGCTRSQILAVTPDARKPIIERAFAWVSARVPYSQSSSHEGYRTDCSGFVSMCWGLSKPGQTTAYFAPGGYANSKVVGWDDLQPGDAVNLASEHIILFAGWLDEGHTRFCSVAEHHSGTVTSAGVSYKSYYASRGFKPITFTHMPGGSTSGGGGATSGTTTGGGSSGGGSSWSCYSQTLSSTMAANACVQSKFDHKWYQCTSGGWKIRWDVPAACTSEHPL